MKKKRFSIIILIIVVVFAVFGGIYTNSHRIENGAARYLAKKYNWEISDIKEIEHQKGYIDYSLFPLDFYFNKYNPKWVYEYNGRKFNVEYTNFHFADDYQLEDIFEWCTEYLQENVDKDVIGVEIPSDIIYQSSEDSYLHDSTLPWKQHKALKKEQTLDILEEINKEGKLNIFYRVTDITNYGNKTKYYYINEKGDRINDYYYSPNNYFDSFYKSVIGEMNKLFNTRKTKITVYTKGIFGREPLPSINKSNPRCKYSLTYLSSGHDFVTKE